MYVYIYSYIYIYIYIYIYGLLWLKQQFLAVSALSWQRMLSSHYSHTHAAKHMYVCIE